MPFIWSKQFRPTQPTTVPVETTVAVEIPEVPEKSIDEVFGTIQEEITQAIDILRTPETVEEEYIPEVEMPETVEEHISEVETVEESAEEEAEEETE